MTPIYSGGNNESIVQNAVGSTVDEWTELVQASNPNIKGMTASYPIIETTSGLTDARLYVHCLYIPEDCTANGIAFFLSTSGSFTADQYSGFGFYSVSGSTATLVAETPDDANLFKSSANAWASKNFTTPYVCSAGVYAISMLSNRSSTTTLPLLAVPTQVVAADVQKYAGSFPISGYVSGNTNSNPASIDLTTLTSNNIRHLLAVI